MQWRLIFTLILMVLVVIFSLANAAPVPFNYLINKTDISLALVIILSALIGALAGVVSGLGRQLKLKRQIDDQEVAIRKLRRQLEEAPGEDDNRGHQFFDQGTSPK